MESTSPATALVEPDDIGAVLRGARERRGVSLDQLAHVTKIRASILRDIERNQRDALPTTIFLRGFVRAYAREVGLDPDATAHRYLEQFEPPPPVTVPAAAPAPVSARIDPQLNWRTVGNVGILIAIVCVVIVYALAHRNTAAVASDSSPVVSHPASRPSTPTPAPARAEVGTGGSASAAAVGATGRALRITLRAKTVCWVSATADGARAVYQLMEPGATRELHVNDAMVLRVGDPQALGMAIDGAAVRPLGVPGHAVTVRITPDNFRQFLSR